MHWSLLLVLPLPYFDLSEHPSVQLGGVCGGKVLLLRWVGVGVHVVSTGTCKTNRIFLCCLVKAFSSIYKIKNAIIKGCVIKFRISVYMNVLCCSVCVHVCACVPLANIGRISGLPQHQVCLLSLNTESNSTGFSFQPEHTQTEKVNAFAVTNSRHPDRHIQKQTRAVLDSWTCTNVNLPLATALTSS